MKKSAKMSSSRPSRKTAAKATKPAAKKAAPPKKTVVKKAVAKKKALPLKMSSSRPSGKAAPVRKAAAKRPAPRTAVPLKISASRTSGKSAALKSNTAMKTVAVGRVRTAQRKEQPQQLRDDLEGNNGPDMQEDLQEQHQPTAERPAPTFDPTPDTNVPMRGQTSFHGAQTARVAANKGNRARIGSHRKH